jgi:hypothetical protein
MSVMTTYLEIDYMENYLHDSLTKTLLCNEILETSACRCQTEHIVEINATDDVRQDLVWKGNQAQHLPVWQ